MCSQCENISWQLGRDEREAEIIALLADRLTEFTYTDEDGQPHWLNGDREHNVEVISALIKGEEQ